MIFEWDDEKAISNLEKHSVSFGEGFFIIGYSFKRILFVVFVGRRGDVIRIISARPPTPTERKLYEEQER
ncbi:MAG: hypothetical protein AUG51_05235 [Acidobacteria bacterium 13_1_20CM_3_53_8]|nr:MAG: hypothetical protein AUG51_05235 [Acidobacteria bacterium 13_1_20CM_3_53_8]